jgi:hypothetical protein
VLSERTESSSVFVAPSGAVTAQLYANPIRVKVGDVWKPLDSTLSKTADGRIAPTQPQVPIGFSAGGSGPAATLAAPDGTVSLGWNTPLPTPKIAGDTVTYPDAAANADLAITAGTSSFEFKVVLKAQPTTAPVFTVPLTVPAGSKLTRLDSGVPVVQTADGKNIALIGTAQMFDATIDPATKLPSTVRPVSSTVTAESDTKLTMTLRPDMSFLSDPATRYPVTIDPALSAWAWDSLDTMVINGALAGNNYDGDAHLYAGTSSIFGTTSRSFIQFTDGTIKNVYVIDADLALAQDTSSTCAAKQTDIRFAGALTTGRTWNTQPTIGATSTSFSANVGSGNGCGSGLLSIPVTALISNWSHTGGSSDTLALVAHNEADGASFKAFFSANTTLAPHITATYATVPDKPTSVHATAGSGQATVTWTAPASNGGDPITSYKITSSPGGITKSVPGTATSGTVLGLTNGTAYNFTVEAINHAGTSGGSTASNTVTPQLPNVPTALTAQHNDTFAPVLQATVSDPNGGSVKAAFTVKDASGATVVSRTSTAVASGTTASVAIARGELHAGQRYTFTAQACLNSGGACSADATSVPVLNPALDAGQKSSFSYKSFRLTDRASMKVNVATGNLLLQTHDLSVSGIGGDLVIGRSFNSAQTDGATFGSPW